MKWIIRGRQKQSVAQTLCKPMTATEICSASQRFDSHIRLRDVWFILRQFRKRRLAECLTPQAITGKLYFWTDFGRKVVGRGLHLSLEPLAQEIDWNRCSEVLRAKTRKAILLELANAKYRSGATASAIRKSLKDRHPLGLNPTLRALKELVREHLVKTQVAGLRAGQKVYLLSRQGSLIAKEIQRQPAMPSNGMTGQDHHSPTGQSSEPIERKEY